MTFGGFTFGPDWQPFPTPPLDSLPRLRDTLRPPPWIPFSPRSLSGALFPTRSELARIRRVLADDRDEAEFFWSGDTYGPRASRHPVEDTED